MPGASRYKVVEEDVLHQIHDATLRLLAETGIVFQHPDSLAVFKRHGARVSGETAFIPPTLVSKAIESAPRTFMWHAVNGARSVVVGEDGRLDVQPNMGPVFAQDCERGRRVATLDDYATCQKLAQASPVVTAAGTLPVSPSDIPPGERHLRLTLETLRHSDKPLISFTGTREDFARVHEMVEIALGKPGFLDDHAVVGVALNPLSPLRFNFDPAEVAYACALRRQPVFALSCALGGVTGPMSLLGLATLMNAELLAALVLTQLVNPGTPFCYGPGSTCADMRWASYATGSPENTLMNIVGVQLARDLYRLPARVMAGLTDSKTPDFQAGLETMQNLSMLVLAGANFLNESLGVLDSIMTTSFEKWLMDEEIIERVKIMARGVAPEREPVSLEVIREVAHTGSYLTHPDTLARFRKRWRAPLSIASPYEQWEKAGSEDMFARARRRLKAIMEEHAEPILDPAVGRDLARYVEKHIG